MAVPQYRDEVLVTLTTIKPPSSFAFPDRRFFLTKEKPTMVVGRTSKRNSNYEATKHNAWFDSPVMSRDHAQFRLDVDSQKVHITDIGSLHGTFKNEHRLKSNAPYPLASGDCIQFGVPIDRNLETYAPSQMRVDVRFGNDSPEDRPKIFKVPDDTDVEDSGSDDDGSIRNTLEILHNNNMKPAPQFMSSRFPPVDRASSNGPSMTYTQGDDVHPTNCIAPMHAPLPPLRGPVYVDLSSPSPDQNVGCGAFSPLDGSHEEWVAEPGEAADEGDEGVQGDEEDEGDEAVDAPGESDIELSDNSTDMDTDSIPPQLSPSQSSHAGSISGESMDGYEILSDVDAEADEFEERDEFENDSRDASLVPTEMNQNAHNNHWAPVPTNSGIDSISQDVILEEPSARVSDKTTPSATRNAYSEILSVSGMGSDVYPVIHLPPQPDELLARPSAPPPWVRQFTAPSYPAMMSCGSYPTPRATAEEIVGEKTGEMAFVENRAENKTAMSPPGPQNILTNCLELKAAKEQVAPVNVNPPFKPVTPVTPGKPKESSTSEILIATKTTKEIATSEWTASGTQFLNSPPTEAAVLPKVQGPALDETSAYKFELSKQAAAIEDDVQKVTTAPQAGPQDTTMADADKPTDAEDPKIVIEQSDASPSSKRKASQISDLTPEEGSAESSQQALRTRKRNLSIIAQKRFRQALLANKPLKSKPDMQAPRELDGPQVRPAKRLRRVAEVLGIAALGGAAVMSALIATAPTL